jgi:hypothetical protein
MKKKEEKKKKKHRKRKKKKTSMLFDTHTNTSAVLHVEFGYREKVLRRYAAGASLVQARKPLVQLVDAIGRDCPPEDNEHVHPERYRYT